MKTSYLNYLALVVLFIFTGCDKSSEAEAEAVVFDVSIKELSVTPERQEESISISSSGEWKVWDETDWCFVSENRGSGSKTLNIIILENPTAKKRVAKLLFWGEDGNSEVLITQDRLEVAEVSYTLANIYSDGSMIPSDKWIITDESTPSNDDFSRLRSALKSVGRRDITLEFTNITSIPSELFKAGLHLEYGSLVKFTAPKVTRVGENAFKNCDALTYISLGEATTIEGWAFDYCTALANLNLPKATTIGKYAFASCSALTSVNLPSAKTIGDRTFGYCTALTDIDLANVTTLDEYVFSYCSGLQNINLPNVTTIGDLAFFNCTTLKKISLPKVTTLGDGIFWGCDALDIVFLPKVETIGVEALHDCTALTNITIAIQSDIKSISYDIFDTINVSNVTLYTGVDNGSTIEDNYMWRVGLSTFGPFMQIGIRE